MVMVYVLPTKIGEMKKPSPFLQVRGDAGSSSNIYGHKCRVLFIRRI
jgi:hypothetical protein